MSHPDGGCGNYFEPVHSFEEAFNFIGPRGHSFYSTTNEEVQAVRGFAIDRTTRTISFIGERNRHGNVCEACWGFRMNCSGTRIGQCVQALDCKMG